MSAEMWVPKFKVRLWLATYLLAQLLFAPLAWAQTPPQTEGVKTCRLNLGGEKSDDTINNWVAFRVDGGKISRAVLDDWSPLDRLLEDGILREGENATRLAEALSAKRLPSTTFRKRKTARAANDNGLVALQSNDLPVAAQAFEEGLRADGEDVELLNNLGYTYLLQGRLDEATDTLREVLLRAPKRVNAWVNLGQVFTLQEKDSLAAGCFTIALRLSSKPGKTLGFVRQWLAENLNSAHSKQRLGMLEDRLAQDWVRDLIEGPGHSVQISISPDNRWRAELDPNHERLTLYNQTRFDEPQMPYFPADWRITAIIWSPDGRQLLATRALGKDADILETWQLDFPDNTPPTKHRLFVTDGEAFSQNDLPAPAGDTIAQQILFGQWSPDGRYLSFWQGMRSGSALADGLPLYVLDTHDGQVQQAAAASLVYPYYHSWSPDSSALAVTEGLGRDAWSNKWLSVFDLSSGKASERVADSTQRPGRLAWSPDGKHIAYAAVSAKVAEAQSDPFAGGSDNPAIAQRRIYLIDPAGGQPRRLNSAKAFQDAPV